MRRPLVALVAAVAVAALSACSLRPKPHPPVAVHDLGPESDAAPEVELPISIMVSEPAAPPWLQQPAMVYRYDGQDASHLHSFAYSRWAAPPARLLGQLLRARLAAASVKGAVPPETAADTDIALWLDLEDFGQVIGASDPQATQPGRAVIRLRATLTARPGGRLVRQRAFAVAEPTPAAADAAAGVRALRAAAERLSVELTRWIADAIAADRRSPLPPADR